METLLIINSLLMLTTLYFIKDVHSDFKAMGKSVQTLKEKLAEFSATFQAQIEAIKVRLGLKEAPSKKK